MGCPFNPSNGFMTKSAREHWMEMHGKSASDIDQSLTANPDPSTPLYFWQLYSLLGESRIEDIVRCFYTRVYADEEEHWLRDAFSQLRSMEHHIDTQSAFWVDCFGGGRQYQGAEYRLAIHHSGVQAVMNAQGAKRWMHHMALTLNEDVDFGADDPRVKPCIVDFLETRMRKYAHAHDWDFDPETFDSLRPRSG
jgi:truncated hemoglobin YjbI